MNLSNFSKNFYNDNKTITYITSQHRFIGELFYASGSNFFPEKITCNHEKYWTARSLFSGKRSISTEMRESFPLKINEIEFAKHFMNRINEKSLVKIAKNFDVNINNINKELFLMALCKQFQAIIYEESEENIINSEYNSLLLNYNTPEQIHSTSQYKNNIDTNLTKAPTRLWLPDAEFATEEQSGFESFTYTSCINNFMDSESNIWGIRSAKGVGKTYLLQKLRRDMNEYSIPQYRKLSKEIEWGTESVRFDNPKSLEKSDIEQLAALWKVAIVCLVINCLDTKISRRQILSNKNLSENINYILENTEENICLNDIINNILIDNHWHISISKNYTVLRQICKKIFQCKAENTDEPIKIFIDKVDQSVLQPGAEIPECNNCYKDTKYDTCTERENGLDYCLEQCRGCCLGCEKFTSSYADEGLRIYGSMYGKRYEHISQWQHIQLALVLAVNSIQLDFRSKIHVYYAIRQESLNAEENLLGANATKIKAHTIILHYSKEEQEEIFNNTIKIQPPDYLYNPNLLKKGRYAEAFVGIDRLCHPHVAGKDESLFECIYRHSFDRAREIQYIGDALALNVSKIKKMKTSEEREEHVKRIIESTAADLVFLTSGTSAAGNRTYYNDKQILLRNYWANPDNFKNFIQEINRNLLFIEDLALICKKINKYSDCNANCRETNCEYHPFSMLYEIGLLGRASYNSSIDKDSEQVFIDSKDITYYRDKAEIFPDNETLFLLHPALTKCIEKNIRGTSIMHFKGFILGKGLTIPREKHKELLEDRRTMNKNDFEEKYYSTISSIPQ